MHLSHSILAKIVEQNAMQYKITPCMRTKLGSHHKKDHKNFLVRPSSWILTKFGP